MELNQKYKAGFIAQVDASLRGEVTYIPIHLKRVGKSFNLMQSRYVLISGATGAGKTSIADETFVLAPYTYLKENKENIHWEVLYFSLERKQMFKHAKWVSWMIYRDHRTQISADDIMGWGEKPLNKTGYDLIRSYDQEMTDLLDHMQIYDGKISPNVIQRAIDRRAHELGTFYWTDEHGIYSAHDQIPFQLFTDENLVEQTKTGPRKYIQWEHKERKFKLYEDDHQYFPDNPKTFVYIIIDGINLLGDKEIIDKISVEIADARDKYGFSPVVVTQQNRSLADINRLKHHGGDLSPQIEDVFKSSQMGFDADVVFGLFDPLMYKAHDADGKYDGYVVLQSSDGLTGSMQTPAGLSRFRSLHILKNSFGPNGAKYGLKFLGESNYFETLPFPDDETAINKVYVEIRQGL
ncbi:hypothetical protein LCGC14_1629350 [marine sediment metagenome]|uniref:SF4 helicase domain-containing protein n=1 Tax=marine sediment metagenome TaxID=412755 RepID=A0A0F9IQ82_9ZZZZ